jgi:hypothetical protein
MRETIEDDSLIKNMNSNFEDEFWILKYLNFSANVQKRHLVGI